MNRRDALQFLSKMSLGFALTPAALQSVITLRSQPVPPMEVPEEVNLIADLILPRTDTPGALDVGAPRFAMYMLKEIRPAEEQVKFDNGLRVFKEKCISETGASFSDLAASEREIILRGLVDSEDAFFKQLHGLILISYFTSEEGMTQALSYNPVPMKFEPCIDVDDTTRGEASYF